MNRIDFHLTSKVELFHSAKTEWSGTGLPQRRVTEPPYPMQNAIPCVMNPVSCNWGLSESQIIRLGVDFNFGIYFRHAETHADDGKQEAAKKLYKVAHEIGRPHYNKNEHIKVINRRMALSTEDEIEALEREADLIKKRCAVEWKPTLSCIDLPSQEREEENRGFCRRVSKYIFGKLKIRRGTLGLSAICLILAVKCYGWHYNDSDISSCVCPDFVNTIVNKLSSYS